MQYPAPGLPELADEIATSCSPTWVGADVDSWGIDHGTWSVLVHAFPDASIPVVQLSHQRRQAASTTTSSSGAKLAPLRERGVLVVGSGNVVHNLRGMDWRAHRTRASTGPSASTRTPRTGCSTDPTEFATLDAHRDFRTGRADAGPLHPALYLAGLAGAEGTGTSDTRVLVDGYAYGSLSMTAYTLGMECPPTTNDGGSPRPPAICPPTAPTSEHDHCARRGGPGAFRP